MLLLRLPGSLPTLRAALAAAAVPVRRPRMAVLVLDIVSLSPVGRPLAAVAIAAVPSTIPLRVPVPLTPVMSLLVAARVIDGAPHIMPVAARVIRIQAAPLRCGGSVAAAASCLGTRLPAYARGVSKQHDVRGLELPYTLHTTLPGRLRCFRTRVGFIMSCRLQVCTCSGQMMTRCAPVLQIGQICCDVRPPCPP